MTNTKITDFLKTLLVVLTATMMLSVATCCYIHAGFGSDSVAAFGTGPLIQWMLKFGKKS